MSTTDYPKRSPFAAVRWDAAQPEVLLDDEWFMLVSLNRIPASEIVAFSKKTFKGDWQKRFEEDLVELLTLMQQPPADTVTLTVQSLTTSESLTRKNIPMTEENRTAIYRANRELLDSF